MRRRRVVERLPSRRRARSGRPSRRSRVAAGAVRRVAEVQRHPRPGPGRRSSATPPRISVGVSVLAEHEPVDLDVERPGPSGPAARPRRGSRSRPCHGRAECAASPRKRASALTEPTQPAWSVLSVGSITTTRSAPSTRPVSNSRGSGLSSSATSSRVKNTKPGRARARPRRPRARARASPRRRPSCRSRRARGRRRPRSGPGRLPCSGTVSTWPAKSTNGRPLRPRGSTSRMSSSA